MPPAARRIPATAVAAMAEMERELRRIVMPSLSMPGFSGRAWRCSYEHQTAALTLGGIRAECPSSGRTKVTQNPDLRDVAAGCRRPSLVAEPAHARRYVMAVRPVVVAVDGSEESLAAV